MFNRKHNQTTEVPVAVTGGTANYPAGYGDQAGRDVNTKAGYGYDQSGANVTPQQQQQQNYNPGHGGGYVQQTPVSYGPNGQPLHARKNNKPANWCAAAFIACWACTWPCHGPCCCGL